MNSVQIVERLFDFPTVSRIKVGFVCEAGSFSVRLGIPAVVCGPGSIDQAHKPDEFVTIDQLQRSDTMLDALLDRLC